MLYSIDGDLTDSTKYIHQLDLKDINHGWITIEDEPPMDIQGPNSVVSTEDRVFFVACESDALDYPYSREVIGWTPNTRDAWTFLTKMTKARNAQYLCALSNHEQDTIWVIGRFKE